jgi:hypothetical protein
MGLDYQLAETRHDPFCEEGLRFGLPVNMLPTVRRINNRRLHDDQRDGSAKAFRP